MGGKIISFLYAYLQHIEENLSNFQQKTIIQISNLEQKNKQYVPILHWTVIKSERVEESPSRDAISPFQMVIATILCAMLGGDLPRASHTMHLPNVGPTTQKATANK